jgi:hypothetical protein
LLRDPQNIDCCRLFVAILDLPNTRLFPFSLIFDLSIIDIHPSKQVAYEQVLLRLAGSDGWNQSIIFMSLILSLAGSLASCCRRCSRACFYCCWLQIFAITNPNGRVDCAFISWDLPPLFSRFTRPFGLVFPLLLSRWRRWPLFRFWGKKSIP